MHFSYLSKNSLTLACNWSLEHQHLHQAKAEAEVPFQLNDDFVVPFLHKSMERNYIKATYKTPLQFSILQCSAMNQPISVFYVRKSGKQLTCVHYKRQ